MLTTVELSISEVITDFLTEMQEGLRAYLAANNRNATGKSSDSIQLANVTDKGGQLVGSGSIKWVFTGRGPGGMPPILKIIDWLNARGLPRAMAWAVARKIAENGTKLYQQGGRTVNGLTETLTPEAIQAFSKNIADTLAVEISSGISNVIN